MVNKYNNLTGLFAQAYRQKTKQDIQQMQNTEWTRVKSNEEAYDALVARLQARIERNEGRTRAM